MPATDTVSGPPAVSVIVPARNEEAALASCLESLVAQSGIAFEIIVVDDHSTDRTREIALSFSNSRTRLRVIEAGTLPAAGPVRTTPSPPEPARPAANGCCSPTPIPSTCPGSLARSLAEAKRRGAALLSYSPEQIVESFWEKAVMPVIFAELAASFRPSEVSDPKSPAAAANGQYILITREAYDAVGGHAAIAASLLEDVALARAVKRPAEKYSSATPPMPFAPACIAASPNSAKAGPRTSRSYFPRPHGWPHCAHIEFVLIVASFAISCRQRLCAEAASLLS